MQVPRGADWKGPTISWRIRSVEPTDGPRFRALRLRALAESPTAFASTLAETEARPASYWERRVVDASAGRDSALFVAEHDGDWVGLAGGYVHEDNGSQVPFLISMWVDPIYRNQGLGGALVARVVDWARGLHAPRLLLEVEATNTAAISLYERHGFRHTGQVQPHPTYSGMEEIIMACELEH